MERVLRTRISELVRARDSADGRASSLQQLTETWVPKAELSQLAHKHFALKEQYAELVSQRSEQLGADLRELTRANRQLEDRVRELHDEAKTANDVAAKLQKELVKLGAQSRHGDYHDEAEDAESGHSDDDHSVGDGGRRRASQAHGDAALKAKVCF